jgi:putative PEP-CTERM system TPR-repeat lipoprotein
MFGHRLLAASLPLLLLACNSRTEEQHLQSARSALERRDYVGATLELKSAVQLNPESARARWLLAQTQLERGDPASAEVELRHARRLQHPQAEVLPLLAQAMVQQGQARRALNELSPLRLPLATDQAALDVELARAYAALGQGERAQAQLRQALDAAPGLPEARLLDAVMLADQGRVDAALQAAQALATQLPQHPQVQLLLGELHRQRGEAEPAQQAYARAIALRPALIQAHVARFEALLQARQLERARAAQVEMAKALPEHPQTRFAAAQLALSQGQRAQAREQVGLAMRGQPDQPRMLLVAGIIELRDGKLGQAEAFFAKASRLVPSDATARLLHARSTLALGQPAKTLSSLQPLLDRENVPLAALTLAGRAHLLLGQAGAAHQRFEQARQRRPEDSLLRTASAVARWHQQPGEAAQAELVAAAAEDQSPLADLALISEQLQRGQARAALASTAQLALKPGQQALAASLRGQILMEQRDFKAARPEFEAALRAQPADFSAIGHLVVMDRLEGRPQQAQQRLQDFLKREHGHVAARLALADLRAYAGAPLPEVAAPILDAIRAQPADASARLALIALHQRHGDTAAAMAIAREAAQALPDDAELLSRLARLQLAAREPRQALATLSQAVDRQPQHLGAQMALADLQLQMQQSEAARKTMAKALALAPRDAAVLLASAHVALQTRQLSELDQLARSLQREHPRSAQGHLMQAEAALARREPAQALPVLRRALALEDTGAAPVRLHQTLLETRQTAEAERFASDWRQRHPRDAQFLNYLGDRAAAQARWPEAERLFQFQLAAQPEHPLALNNLAWAKLQLRKPEALQLARRAHELAPQEPQLLDTLAQCQAAFGQARQALDTQQRAIALAPESPPLKLTLAKLYLGLGEKDKARPLLQALALQRRAQPQDEVHRLLDQVNRG